MKLLNPFNFKMPRPFRRRRICGRPNVCFFKPAGIRLRDLGMVSLSIDEFEALRLVDYENIPQEEAAKKMKISQPTLSRILSSARKKLAEAIIEGRAIRIEEEY